VSSTAVHRRIYTLSRSLRLPTFQVAEDFALPAATASFSLRFTIPRFHCWQPSIFGCWSSGAELPATGGYVGTWLVAAAVSLATFSNRLEAFLFTELFPDIRLI